MTVRPWIVVAGGGTAGHVLPALAVADTLVGRGVDAATIAFCGSERGVEKRLVPAAGYALTMLAGRGLLRSFAPRAVLTNLRSSLGLLGATLRTIISFLRARPAVVLSVGGYASVPACLAARLTRVPLVIAESNARAGRSVRAFSKYAKASAVAFPTTGLPRAVITGNPVRQEILDLARKPPNAARADARNELGIDESTVVVTVFGGSLGARRINETVLALCNRWADRPMLIRHVVGQRDLDWAQEHRNGWLSDHPGAALDYQQVAYEDEMPRWYVASDVIVCRAGATSVADLAVLGVPAILVPLPGAAEDHQRANARAVVDDGAAVLLEDRDLSADRLAEALDGLLDDPDRRSELAAAQRRRSRPDAGEAIAELLMANATRHPPVAGRSAG